ncbi:hypothetical protein BJY01DRAFT_248747 [Aspergillus pseudoustus]|uniref:Uncharacterized protein n=1 Tax=Aspergillus pseudoustus TaxID=1810923 RepID=A0ABR4JW68_9EURO
MAKSNQISKPNNTTTPTTNNNRNNGNDLSLYMHTQTSSIRYGDNGPVAMQASESYSYHKSAEEFHRGYNGGGGLLGTGSTIGNGSSSIGSNNPFGRRAIGGGGLLPNPRFTDNVFDSMERVNGIQSGGIRGLFGADNAGARAAAAAAVCHRRRMILGLGPFFIDFVVVWARLVAAAPGSARSREAAGGERACELCGLYNLAPAEPGLCGGAHVVEVEC